MNRTRRSCSARRPFRNTYGALAASLLVLLAASVSADARVVLQPALGSSSEEVVGLVTGIGAEVLAVVPTDAGPIVVAHADEPHIGVMRSAPTIDPFFRIDATCQGWTRPCTDAPVTAVLQVVQSSVPTVAASLDLLGGEISREDPPFYEVRVPVESLESLSEEIGQIEGASLVGLHELVTSGPGGCGGPSCAPRRERIAVGEGRRFAVEAWTVPVAPGSNGLELGVDSAGFYFFSPGNLEVLVKVLDGCAVNGHWWIFAAGLTDQLVRIDVEDLGAGAQGNDATRRYENSQGQPFVPIIDLEAFPCASQVILGTTARYM